MPKDKPFKLSPDGFNEKSWLLDAAEDAKNRAELKQGTVAESLVAEGAAALGTGAAALLALDRTIQGWTKAIDEKVAQAVKKLPKRTPTEINTSCEIGESALPVSKSLKAVHYGTLKIVFRVLPRMIESFLMKELDDLLGKVAVRIAAKKMAGFIPFFGSILSSTVGVYDAVKFYNQLEEQIHAVLGCEGNKLDKAPMRKALNKMVAEMKSKVALEPVRVKMVRTRNP